MEHSPSPWTALETGLILDANGAVVVPDVYGDEQEDKEANAALIAAAPELLEALRAIRTTSEIEIDDGELALCALAEIRARTMAAIAKAEGK